MAGNETLTHSTLVDTCNFPSIRFGRYYTGRLPNVTVSGSTVTNPGPETTYTYQAGTAKATGYSETATSSGSTVDNYLIQGLPSVSAEADVQRNTASGVRTIKDSSYTVDPQYATTVQNNVANNGGKATVVTSSFGGIASDVHVQRTGTRGPVTVIGKSCGPS